MRSPLTTRGQLVPQGSVGAPQPTLAPVLNPGAGSSLFPGEPGSATTRNFDANRVVLAGGNMTSEILHPSIIPFEQLYRRLPEEGMFSSAVSPSRPFTFELGAFTVPDRMTLLLFDLRPDIYRFSGVDPGDYVPVEHRRFGSIMGFDITVDQKHVGTMAFELDPVAIQRTSQQAFASQNTVHPQANPSQAAVSQASSFANVSGMGNALQPQRPQRYGALSIPFTIFARSKQTIQVRCVIFRPIPTPIAFIEYDMAGVLVPESWLVSLEKAIMYPQDASKEGIR
jgi:hypothetical protein